MYVLESGPTSNLAVGWAGRRTEGVVDAHAAAAAHDET
jgi:hypothetical protein